MPMGCFGVGLLNSFFPLPGKYRATQSHVHTLHSINAGRVKTIKPVQPNVCFCQTVWKQYLFGLYPNWLSEHGQQHFNICVTAHKPSGDSLAAPAAFSTVSVNMHNIWNTSVRALPAWRPSSATKPPCYWFRYKWATGIFSRATAGLMNSIQVCSSTVDPVQILSIPFKTRRKKNGPFN